MLLYIILYIFVVIVFLSLYKVVKYNMLYIILIVIGLAGVINLPVYSVYDESSHFDYINFILLNHSLPTTHNLINSSQLLSLQSYTHLQNVPYINQYEAVQPPLYYLLASVTGFLLSLASENLLYRFLLIRTIGVLLLLVSVYFIGKTYQLLIKNEILNDNQLLFTSICCLFFLSPNFLFIMIPISNEHLVVALVSLLTYFIVNIIFEKQENSFLLPILGAIIVASLTLTKLTTVYFSIFLGGFILFKKNIKDFFTFGILLLVLIAPWLGFNYVNYGKLTAMEEHVIIVKPILNPGNISYSVNDLVSNFPKFIASIWFNNVQNDMKNIKIPLITDFLTLIMIFSLIFPFIIVFKKIYRSKKEKKLNDIFYSSKVLSSTALPLVFSLPIILNFCILVYSSFLFDINFVLGRYFLMNLIYFIILFYLSTNVIRDEYKNVATTTFILISCLFILVNIKNYLYIW